MPDNLNKRRHEAVRLRLDGHTVAETSQRTGLSAPTVSAAWKAFREGGWESVDVRQRGRRTGQTPRLGEAEQRVLRQCLADWPPSPQPGWSSRELVERLAVATGQKVSTRAIEHWLAAQGLKPAPVRLEGLERKRSAAGRWYRQQVLPVLEQIKQANGTHWQGGVRVAPQAHDDAPCRYQLYLHGKRGALLTRCFTEPPNAGYYLTLFERLATAGPVALVFHGAFFRASSEVQAWLSEHPHFHLLSVPADAL
ncbi:helix-turn-helix domain-containing protein [Halomonas korlensis]|uniref:Transposase n=1 Tax=Halomonas korlensis TaxID=463301 RepID=A0A1I7HX65_9GAMM|nr:helix-turn-helix domain-containing protein [Halomonas korlensis]SFU65076.1 Transposase [Halomonas korlensis]